MKTKFLLIIVIAILLFTGCAKIHEKECNETESETQVIHVEMDQVIYEDYADLYNSADLVVRAHCIGNIESKLEYEYDGNYQKDVLVFAITSADFKIDEIYKGLTDDDLIKISQCYGVEESTGNLVMYSDLTEFNEDDEWIYFLSWDSNYETYFACGDYTGRYSTADISIMENIVNSNDYSDDDARIAGVWNKNLISIEMYKAVFENLLQNSPEVKYD